MTTLAALLPHTSAPVLLSETRAAEETFRTSLPADLRDFLLVSDGSDWTAFPKSGFQIHPLRAMLDLWSLPSEARSEPQHIIDVATDGSRERFCFDPQGGDIVLIDIVGPDPTRCASTLTELVQRLSSGWNPFSVLEG